jgi:hypothetical protein
MKANDFPSLRRVTPASHAGAASRRQRGVALIITISVLSIMFVLVVGYATVSRTSALSASSHRDYVSSRYLAMGGFNRAMAQIAYAYATNVVIANSGVGTSYSCVDTNDQSYVNQFYATDIDHLVTNQFTGLVFVDKGADGVIDWVTLPGQDPNNLATRPQWLAMKDNDGLAVGRVAYVITSASLNINAIGNLVPNQINSSIKFNSRNDGYSVAELNFPAALMAIDPGTWDYATATNDALAVLYYRYKTPPQSAGDGLIGDNALYGVDGQDKNGDGLIEGADITGVPQNYLKNSDGTDKMLLTPLGDDLKITDLKQLHTIIPDLNGSQGRFLSKFAKLQQYFTTESSMQVPAYMVNLNDTYAYPEQTNLFHAVLNQLTNCYQFRTDVQRAVQVAANIVSYISTNGINDVPLNMDVTGKPVVGVGQTPLLNEVVFDLFATVGVSNVLVGTTQQTNLYVTVRCQPRIEFWYPYCNALPVGARTLDFSYQFLNNSDGGGTEMNMSSAIAENKSAAADAIPGVLFGTGIIDPIRFPIVTNSVNTIGTAPFTKTWELDKAGVRTTPADVVISNCTFSALFREGSYTNDFTPAYTNRVGVTFTASQILAAVGATGNGSAPYIIANPQFPATITGVSAALTNAIVFAKNDPRIKEWFPAFANAISNSAVAYHTLGTTNHSISVVSYALPITTNIFHPDLGEDGTFVGTGLPKGIGPKTFYVRQTPSRRFISVAELGRVHRGDHWSTIDLRGGGVDGNLLDRFTIVINTNIPNSYVHGRVNINAPTSALPIWAALFAGMPIKMTAQGSGVYVTNWLDTTAGAVDPAFTQCQEMGQIFGSRAGAFSHLGALTIINDFTNLPLNHAAAFPAASFTAITDEDREEVLSRISNLVGTQSQGNAFTIWAWGQCLRGLPVPPYPTAKHANKDAAVNHANTNRFVTAETLIVGMVRPEFVYSGGVPPDYTNTNLNLRIIYYRYNPDLELY